MNFSTKVAALDKGLTEHWRAAIMNLALWRCLWSLTTKLNLVLKNVVWPGIIWLLVWCTVIQILLAPEVLWCKPSYKCIKLLTNKCNFIYWGNKKLIWISFKVFNGLNCEVHSYEISKMFYWEKYLFSH